MSRGFLVAVGLILLTPKMVYAINAKYKQQLERSGCTQVSEAQGCDIHSTKDVNAKAGFVAEPIEHNDKPTSVTPYAGRWTAKTTAGAIMANIRIDANEHVWVNGKKVKAKRSDGALLFNAGKLSFIIQGDRRLKDEDRWVDFHGGTKGLITPK